MPHASFLFHPDLTFFLADERRKNGAFTLDFKPGQSVKHLIESNGTPHTEVGRIEVGGQPVGLDYQVREGDRVSVYPATTENDPLPGEARFVLDNHLGRLAAYLRMLGFDTLYRNDYDDEELAQIAEAEGRILVTRDRRLLMRKAIRYGYCPRSLDSLQQIVEVVSRFDLIPGITPFQRCLRCNARLKPVSKEVVLDRLMPLTRLYYDEFHLCPDCGQIYWKGSHYERMQSLITHLRQHCCPPNPSENG